MIRNRRHLDRTSRRGSLLPAIAAAILAVGCCLALVVDKLWLDAARGELRTAVEAAALAAAGRLADDDRINPAVEPEWLAEAARQAAFEAAAANLVAGAPLQLDALTGGSIRLGRHVLHSESDEYRFLETDYFPTSVRVEAARARSFGNPIVRLFSGLTGYSGGDAVAVASAAIGNTVVGLRPFEGGPVPAWPLAVYEWDPSGERRDTWRTAIEEGQGADAYSFDRDSRTVRNEPDGLPELTLHFLTPGENAEDANVQLVDVGSGLVAPQLARQFSHGWSVEDLIDFDGALRFDGPELTLDCTAALDASLAGELAQLVGQKRILLLYSAYSPASGGRGRVVVSRIVAGRIMAVTASESGVGSVVVQPAVVATRTALLGDLADPSAPDAEDGHPYVYKISLTH